MNKTNNRVQWIDNIKIFGCVLVVLGHFCQSMIKSGIVENTAFSTWFIDTIYLFHVNLFFIASGYLYQKFSKVYSLKSYGKNVLKKFIILGVPYFVFTTCTVLMKTIFSDDVNTQAGGLADALFVSPIPPYWYLFTLFFMFVFIPVFQNKKIFVGAFAAAVILKIFLPQILEIFSEAAGFELPYFITSTVQNAVWFLLGMSFSLFKLEKYFKNWVAWLMVGIFVVLSVFSQHWQELLNNSIFTFAASILACLGFCGIFYGAKNSKKGAAASYFCIQYTLPVYLMHTICASAVRILLIKIGIFSPFIHIPLGIAATFALPALAALIMRKLRPLNILFEPGKYLPKELKR